MNIRSLAFMLGLLAIGASTVRAQDVSVDVVNRSVPILCAEDDNVYIQFLRAGIRHMRIEAVHPPYIDKLTVDNTLPDFTNCDMSADPVFHAQPKREVLFEDQRMKLVLVTQDSFWRPSIATVRVGAEVRQGVHLVQLFWKHRGALETEVIVMYPQDGYWRAKPLPPAALSETAYGSSFLVGPVTFDQRPVVDLTEVTFDPANVTFGVRFRAGGTATLKISPDANRTAVDVEFDPGHTADVPFAALRSMYVASENGDVDIAQWADQGQRRTAPIMQFQTARTNEARFGRDVLWPRNTSAPDMVFRGFR